MSELWNIPRIWEGATCFILGGGPSLSKVPFEQLHDKRVIALNDAYKLHQWDCMYFKDKIWYNRESSANDSRPNSEVLHTFAGLKVTSCEQLLGEKGLKVCGRGERDGIEPRLNYLCKGASAGQEAINLAVRLGVAKIALLGYDMRVVDKRHNWHSNHRREIPVSVYTDKFIPKFRGLQESALDVGVEVVNCTEDSGLKEFPYESLDQILHS